MSHDVPQLFIYFLNYQMKDNRVAYICSTYAMRRSDKRPDRVEISPEQLSAAAIEAEVYTVAVKSVMLYPQAYNSVHVKEISSHSAISLPQQQSYLSPLLQRLAAELQRPIQVLGWYHSHPHITVWPSHVGKCIYQVYRNRHRPCCFPVAP